MATGEHEGADGAPRGRVLPAAEGESAAGRLKAAIDALEAVVHDRSLLGALSEEEQHRLLTAAGDVFNPDVVARRQWGKAMRRQEKARRPQRDEAVLATTGMRRLREKPVFTTPNFTPPAGFEQEGAEDDLEPREVTEPRHCYVCKQPYVEVHHFYDQLCRPCGDFNFGKRSESADLDGRVALLTGGRVKIGYQAGIKLLRAGAHLIVTTRFPRDCAARYARESDFADWADRLEVFGLDLRHTPSVEAFCTHLNATRGRLDFIVNNACQTVRRPPEFYSHMLEAETASARTMPSELRALLGAYEGLRGVDLLPAGLRRYRGLAPGGNRRSGRAVAGAAARRGSAGSARPVPPGTPRSRPAAGRPAGAELVAAPALRGLLGRAARDAARQRRRAVHPQRPAQAADARAPRSATSTSSTSRPSRGSSTAEHKTTGTRTPTWPRPP